MSLICAQLRPADTNAAVLYNADLSDTPAPTWQFETGSRGKGYIECCNVSSGIVQVRIFVTKKGTTLDQNTAIVYDRSVAVGGTLPYIVPGGCKAIGVRSNTASAINFTYVEDENA